MKGKISKKKLKKLIEVDYQYKCALKKHHSPLRYQEWIKLPKVILPNVIDSSFISVLRKRGMLSKTELVSGGYYLGTCRNAMVARWNVEGEYFTFMRTKFNHVYPENILHIEDDNGYDLFVPFKEVTPHEYEIIREAYIKSESSEEDC